MRPQWPNLNGQFPLPRRSSCQKVEAVKAQAALVVPARERAARPADLQVIQDLVATGQVQQLIPLAAPGVTLPLAKRADTINQPSTQ